MPGVTRKRATWTPTLASWRQPLHWSAPRDVTVRTDLFAPATPAALRWLTWAVMASSSEHRFTLTTAHPGRAARWLAGLARASRGAAGRYERRMRAHFRRYKRQFREGYSLPEPPTPELRHLYDRAARIERRAPSPDGRTVRDGFSGGEYHWRPWPLDNVVLGAGPCRA